MEPTSTQTCIRATCCAHTVHVWAVWADGQDYAVYLLLIMTMMNQSAGTPITEVWYGLGRNYRAEKYEGAATGAQVFVQGYLHTGLFG